RLELVQLPVFETGRARELPARQAVVAAGRSGIVGCFRRRLVGRRRARLLGSRLRALAFLSPRSVLVHARPVSVLGGRGELVVTWCRRHRVSERELRRKVLGTPRLAGRRASRAGLRPRDRLHRRRLLLPHSVESLLDHLQREEVLLLLMEDPSKPGDVRLVELAVPGRGSFRVDEPLALEEANLRDRDVRELLAQDVEDLADRKVRRVVAQAAARVHAHACSSTPPSMNRRTNRPTWTSSRCRRGVVSTRSWFT